jgi:very-short-patch-repair endonuclease
MLTPATVISSDFASLVGWGFAALLAILVVRFLAGQFLRNVLGGSAAKAISSDNMALRSKPILSDAEARFLRSLEKAVEGEYLVWPQLPLWTFIESRTNDRGTAAGFKNQINLKRVDFCLVDRHTCAVHTAIELDDRTHQRSDRQRRDAFVEDVLKRAGVSLIRIPGATAYDPQAIRRQLGLTEERNVKKLASAR